MSETALHNAVADFLKTSLLPPAWFTTFPAGGGGKARGGKLKRAGLMPGVPDIVICAPPDGRAYWIELKWGQGDTSTAQDDCHAAIKAAGGKVAICWTLDAVKEALRLWDIPVRASRFA
jgi:hypothetical protein